MKCAIGEGNVSLFGRQKIGGNSATPGNDLVSCAPDRCCRVSHRSSRMRPASHAEQVRIPGDKSYRFGSDAKPLADQLHKARLVALPSRQGTNCHCDGVLRRDLDGCALMRRAACRLNVTPNADAATQALRHRGGTARREAVPIGERNGIIEDFPIEAAVISHSERIGVGQRLGGNEIRATEGKAVKSACMRSAIDEPLYYEHNLRPTGAA